jgi:putative component of membrane protein insertase Oxa1/YidC/SpoIIIJ protein YidD
MFGTRTFSARQIPGLVPGIFFLTLGPASAGVSLELAGELFAERQWEAARVESRRALAEAGAPEEAAQARLLSAQAAFRLGRDRKPALVDLRAVRGDEQAPLEIRCAAAYELGLAEWENCDRAAAFSALLFAYQNARAAPLFWRAGCSLYFLMKSDKRLRREEAAVWRSLQSCRDAWPLEIWRECRPRPKGGSSWASAPGRWIVKFYRAQIGPAIGSRCDLQPSCSEYFRQASHTHGLLGIPIMADRFVREPSVVSAKEKPVVMPDGRIRFADPLSDHDFWMKGKK